MRNRNLLTVTLTFVISIILGTVVSDYHEHNYAMKQDYSISFATGKAEGNFKGLKGNVKFSPENINNALIDVSVDVSTIQTGNTKKDDHALNSKWFDAESYPLMKFQAESIKNSKGNYIAEGILTIKDVSKQVAIPFSYDIENDIPYLNGEININRKDFNINGNLFGFIVGKEVEVKLRVPAAYNQ